MKRGAKLALAVISDTGILLDTVKEFLRRAEHLQKIVGKATFDTVQDIKAMLYDEQSMPTLFPVAVTGLVVRSC